jgi:hypothetical protein
MLASYFLESLAFVEAVEEEGLESEVSVLFGPFFSSKENRNGEYRAAADYG